VTREGRNRHAHRKAERGSPQRLDRHFWSVAPSNEWLHPHHSFRAGLAGCGGLLRARPTRSRPNGVRAGRRGASRARAARSVRGHAPASTSPGECVGSRPLRAECAAGSGRTERAAGSDHPTRPGTGDCTTPGVHECARCTHPNRPDRSCNSAHGARCPSAQPSPCSGSSPSPSGFTRSEHPANRDYPADCAQPANGSAQTQRSAGPQKALDEPWLMAGRATERAG
jgi:hypothetical protein